VQFFASRTSARRHATLGDGADRASNFSGPHRQDAAHSNGTERALFERRIRRETMDWVQNSWENCEASCIHREALTYRL